MSKNTPVKALIAEINIIPLPKKVRTDELKVMADVLAPMMIKAIAKGLLKND